MRIFFASDLHGSERCFRKFLNAARFYDADVLVLGGDLTGKAILPIIRLGNDRYETRLLTNRMGELSESELPKFMGQVRDTGFYPFIAGREEMDAFSDDEAKMEQLFSDLIRDSLTRWAELADERLRPISRRCYVIPGNDDMDVVDDVLDSATDVLVNVDREKAWIADEYEVIGVGFSNPTPWKTPRELPEKELGALIETKFAKVESPRRAIANFHCPPINTALDQAPALTDDLRPILAGSQTMMASVGSSTVRSAFERYQPLLGLHGHVHESRGAAWIGKTLCLNPGSEYGEGILRGAIVELKGDRVTDHRFVTG